MGWERGGGGGGLCTHVLAGNHIYMYSFMPTHTHTWQDISASLIELGSVAKPDARVEAYRAKRRCNIICQSHEVVMG